MTAARLTSVFTLLRQGSWVVILGLAWGASAGDPPVELGAQVKELRQQNEQLQRQLRDQQELIERLSQKVTSLEKRSSDRTSEPEAAAPPSGSDSSREGFRLGNLILSGEAGVGLFRSGSGGQFPHGDFRVDEARLFLDAKVWNDVYLYGQLDLLERESTDETFHLGELYVDVEAVLKRWDLERALNFRVGRFYIPFGEEYLTRFAIDNALISHSLSDIWGSDEGVEAYGAVKKFSYVIAVQNGGLPILRDFNSDKAVVGRLGYDPAKWLHLSVSGMRTGDLSVSGDRLSAVWFGNGFFRGLGPPATTSSFHADLVEGDAQLRWTGGQLQTAGGYVYFGDNNTAANDAHDVYYYYAEGRQHLVGKLYAAGRVSQMFAPKGFPLVGNGNFGKYLFGDLTERLWRISLGLGYRWNSHLVLKGEYTFNGGRELGGESRNHEDMLAFEAAVGF